MLVLKAKGERGRIDLVEFAPDSSALLTDAQDGQGVRLWEGLPNPGQPRLYPDIALRGLNPIQHAQFTPDGRSILLRAKPLGICDRATGTVRAVEMWDATYGCHFALAPDGLTFLATQYVSYGQPLGRITSRPLADPTAGAALWVQELDRQLNYPPVFLSRERFAVVDVPLAGSRDDMRCTVRSARTGELLFTCDASTYGGKLHPSPCGSMFATPNATNVHIFAVGDSVELRATLQNDSRKLFTGIAFHPSGRYLAATSNDETVKLYDTATWEVAHTFTWKIGRVRSVCFSPDGALAAAGSDKGQVVVWDVDL